MNWRETIEAALARHAMLRAGNRLGIAVSGGADSVFLLRALREMGLAAAVLHVNHQLRGDESDRDEVFVRRLARELHLPCRVQTAPVPAGNTEQEARRARYLFFAEQIEAGVCDAVATGHTLDDQAETVLSRFLRGSGTGGLSGILPSTAAGIIRPLLDLRRHDIRKWLADRNFAWQEDCSNADTGFLRNRIRLEIMPELATLNPSLAATLASTADWAREEEEYWKTEIDRLAERYLIVENESVLLQTLPVLQLPDAVARRLLRRGIELVRGSLRGIDFRHIEGIRALMRVHEGSGRIQLPGLDIYRSFDWLRLAPLGFDSRLERDFQENLPVPGALNLPDRRIFMEMELVSNADVYNSQMDALDWAKCAGSLILRNWRPGDNYTPKGSTNAAKIKTLFQDFRVPLWERRTWPVIVRHGVTEESILWTRRFGVAAEFAAGPETRQILLIRERGESKPILPTSMIASAQPNAGVRDEQNSAERARIQQQTGEHVPGERSAEVL